ncbi:LPS export ABC transporter periplasmic protein LptC [Xanthovirga aplysinae]|uniref:LPS export ABC transporter periplasmic protein LptC n=1 Tax=Xanthovirga aplysinae TaxID=2529853 RepID=UPI0012BCF33D|nr:LPS export ABC transporter periplasmic protein LptC [Xanthovirga aplysinae]MTI33437.1 LPS export ABC transporter periplasmic protein LptC [Xanthovirga aplysinae]
MRRSLSCFIFFLSLIIGFTACSPDKDNKALEPYDGPLLEAVDVEMLVSDSAVVRMKLTGKRQWDFKNGNREFPEGLFMEFLEPDGSITSTIKADSGFYTSETNLYRAKGDVVVVSKEEEEKELYTDELFWDPAKEKIYTDKYVKIITLTDTLEGTGLESDQNFINYEILNPKGSTILDDDEEF